MTDTPQASTLSRRAALAVLGAAAAAAVASPAFAVGAIKHYIIIDLKPGMDMLALDRWYMTFHAPQVRRAFKAWQRNYVSYRSYAVTEEARKLGVLNGRMTEIQFDSLADFRESRPNNLYGDLRSFTPPPKGWSGAQFETTTATIPVNPQTVFLSNPTPPKETPYLRWIVLFRYPAGVTAETGDAWFKDALAPQIAKLPGVRRFVAYNTVTDSADFPRVAEIWFDDYDAWKSAFVAPAPTFTAPPWGGQFPFVETRSMFIGENPDVDFINDRRVIP
jgi:hypothetical protein